MKKSVYVWVLFIMLLVPNKGWPADIIPYPVKMELNQNEFVLTTATRLVCDKELESMAGFYNDLLNEYFGFRLKENGSSSTKLLLRVNAKMNLPDEGYRIDISEEKIRIESVGTKGVFYAFQSLFQLAQKDPSKQIVKIPLGHIEDYPRFGWRGCMLDVSRTFMNVTLVKRYIDLMAAYKMNVLHLHLTDDQGWRVEIKKYPRLTTVGSKFAPEFNEMGGYYTQDDVRQLVKYAEARNITIVPEIDMPGHVCAALAAYPELSCRGVCPKIHPFMMGPGIHTEVFCAGKPNTYEFIYDVLDELLELFPSEYIHIGGDEAPKKEWKVCRDCQQMMKDNQLANEEELQSLFVKKIGEYLSRKGRRLIGWDEIIDGGKLKGDEYIMYWRSWVGKNVITQAEKGFKIVSSPVSHCYFDYSYDQINTKAVYQYEPVPDTVSVEAKKNFVGVQANFWSHIDRSESGIDNQLFPRLLALSEVGWTMPQNKDWRRFKSVAKEQTEILREKGVNCHYDKTIYNVER